MSEFVDQNQESDLEKAKQFLDAFANSNNEKYFYGDGYPRQHQIRVDAKATLKVLIDLESSSLKIDSVGGCEHGEAINEYCKPCGRIHSDG